MKRLTARAAGIGMLILIGLVLLFHLCIVVGIIPYSIVWGGKVESSDQICILETFSIATNLLIAMVVAVRIEIIKWNWPSWLVKKLLWLFATLFALNTVGNLFAENIIEMLVFTPITLLSSAMMIFMAVSRK